MRSVPLDHAELVSAVEGGAFPHERHWIDFKRRLYPERPGGGKPDRAAMDKVNEELARDLASMAERGGYLVYGVKEDKVNHAFVVDEMVLPTGLHETVDQVARDRITPPLPVIPTLVPNPDEPGIGFLVVEIPASADSPHMADHTYWGRSETGRVRLRDDQIERLMLQRSQCASQLLEEIKATVEADPVPTEDRTACHFYFTALPAQWWPDMFAAFTRDHAARSRLSQLCGRLVNEIVQRSGGQRDWQRVAFALMGNNFRTQRVAAGWVRTWADRATEGNGRAVGVDDNGPVRYIDLAAGGSFPPWPESRLVYDVLLLHKTTDMIRLVAALSNEVGYRGSWLVGVHLDRLRGLFSQLSDVTVGRMMLSAPAYDADTYTETIRASHSSIQDEPEVLAGKLMRRLLRGLGSEAALLKESSAG